MGLLISFDPAGLPPVTVSALDDLIAALQTWAGKIEAFGKWRDVTYSQGIYSANAGAWTVDSGDQLAHRYCVIGDVMLLHVWLSTTATGAGMGSQLRVTLPDNRRLLVPRSSAVFGTLAWDGTAASGTGVIAGDPSPDNWRIRLLRDLDGTAWPSSDTDIDIGFTAVLPLVPL